MSGETKTASATDSGGTKVKHGDLLVKLQSVSDTLSFNLVISAADTPPNAVVAALRRGVARNAGCEADEVQLFLNNVRLHDDEFDRFSFPAAAAAAAASAPPSAKKEAGDGAEQKQQSQQKAAEAEPAAAPPPTVQFEVTADTRVPARPELRDGAPVRQFVQRLLTELDTLQRMPPEHDIYIKMPSKEEVLAWWTGCTDVAAPFPLRITASFALPPFLAAVYQGAAAEDAKAADGKSEQKQQSAGSSAASASVASASAASSSAASAASLPRLELEVVIESMVGYPCSKPKLRLTRPRVLRHPIWNWPDTLFAFGSAHDASVHIQDHVARVRDALWAPERHLHRCLGDPECDRGLGGTAMELVAEEGYVAVARREAGLPPLSAQQGAAAAALIVEAMRPAWARNKEHRAQQQAELRVEQERRRQTMKPADSVGETGVDVNIGFACSNRLYNLRLPLTATIADVKAEAWNRKGAPAHCLDAVCFGRKLFDGLTLAEAGFRACAADTAFARIFMVYRPDPSDIPGALSDAATQRRKRFNQQLIARLQSSLGAELPKGVLAIVFGYLI